MSANRGPAGFPAKVVLSYDDPFLDISYSPTDETDPWEVTLYSVEVRNPQGKVVTWRRRFNSFHGASAFAYDVLRHHDKLSKDEDTILKLHELRREQEKTITEHRAQQRVVDALAREINAREEEIQKLQPQHITADSLRARFE